MRTTGKSGFKMRSGNKPSGFKMMGSSPANIRNFGIGKGDSPYKETDYVKMQKESAKIDPRYGEMTPEEYKAEVQRQVKSKKETGSYNASNTGSEKTNVEKTNVEKKNEQKNISLNDIESKSDITEKRGGNLGEVFKGLGKVGIGALTSGLDEVYGSGKIQFAGGGTKFIPGTKDKDEDDKSGEKKVDELINKQV